MVSYHVVHGETPEIRASYIEFWIRVAAHCRDLNNFNAVMEIISALNASAVHRLKKSWALVSRTVGSLSFLLLESSSTIRVLCNFYSWPSYRAYRNCHKRH